MSKILILELRKFFVNLVSPTDVAFISWLADNENSIPVDCDALKQTVEIEIREMYGISMKVAVSWEYTRLFLKHVLQKVVLSFSVCVCVCGY